MGLSEGHTRVRAPAAAVLPLALAAALLFGRLAGDPASAATATAAGQSAVIKSKTYGLPQPDNRTRFEVLCGGGKVPLGGGIKATPGPDADGEGVYPNSYERLGNQGGYHVTAALVDLLGGATKGRSVTLQVVCLPDKPGRINPPHKTVFVQPGETKSLDIKCTGNRKLIGGGYQRTTFVSNGGDRIVESRALSANTWRVTARADQNFGGELTGIAYCLRSKKPLLRTVTASLPVAPQTPGSVTTPSCPKGRVLGFTGFSTAPTDKLVYMGSTIDSGWTTTASGFNDGATASTLTAYGYCLRA